MCCFGNPFEQNVSRKAKKRLRRCRKREDCWGTEGRETFKESEMNSKSRNEIDKLKGDPVEILRTNCFLNIEKW